MTNDLERELKLAQKRVEHCARKRDAVQNELASLNAEKTSENVLAATAGDDDGKAAGLALLNSQIRMCELTLGDAEPHERDPLVSRPDQTGRSVTPRSSSKRVVSRAYLKP